jgi:hypothetical protein
MKRLTIVGDKIEQSIHNWDTSRVDQSQQIGIRHRLAHERCQVRLDIM